MKAWLVRIRGNFEVAVIFAETRGKARDLARCTDACEGAEFCDIEVRRLPKADKYIREGKTEMGWDNPQDRKALVEEFGFTCEYADLVVCETCSAKECCDSCKDELRNAEAEND